MHCSLGRKLGIQKRINVFRGSKNESVILTHELMATVRESQKHLGAGEEISVS